MPRSNARLLCTFSFRPFSVVFNGFLEVFYPSSAIDDDDRRKKRDAIQKCSDFPGQGYVDSNGYVLGKLEKSVGTIDFSKNRPTDGSSQNWQQVAQRRKRRTHKIGFRNTKCT
jgi:hypothetical protein